jgi:hypothetical protein
MWASSHALQALKDSFRKEYASISERELHLTSGNIFRRCMSASRRLRWAGHVARMGERRDAYKL